MKPWKLFINILTFLILFTNGMAQVTYSNGKTPEERAKNQTEWMKTELSLDSIQVEKVHSINLEYATKMESIKNTSGERRQKIQMLRSLSSDKDSELKKIFTKEQYKAYQRKKDDIRTEAKSRYRGR